MLPKIWCCTKTSAYFPKCLRFVLLVKNLFRSIYYLEIVL